MGLSDWEIQKLDEDYGRIEDAQSGKRRKCPIHGCTLILGQGYVVDGESVTEYWPDGKCPECLDSEITARFLGETRGAK
jgi:hypothetical protein